MSTIRSVRRRSSTTVGLVAGAAVAAGCLLAPAAFASPTLPIAPAAIVPAPISHSADDAALSLAPLGTFESGVFDESAAEIVVFHGNRLFVVNAQAGAVDVLDVTDPTSPVKLYSIAGVGVANSVSVRADGLGVIALENVVKTEPGTLLFFDADAASPTALGSVTVGALPDMVTISKDGAYAVVANEGEPADDFSSDPEGSIGVVALPDTVSAPSQDAVRIADFHEFEEGGAKTLPADVRVFGPQPEADLPVSRNLEPEYITIDGGTAYAALQEANAIAVIDLATAEVTEIFSLGFKDHGIEGNGLDASDRDGGISIRTYPGLYGIYMPDGMQSYQAGGETYLVTANEGDAREWGDYVEPVRVKDLGDDGLAPICADSPLAALTGDADLGRLNVTTENGLDAAAGCYRELYAQGARSFSIWTTDGTQVFDSGDQFERITAEANPEFFNSNHSESNLEGRSDDKGPEPENVTIGVVGDATYAFIGFERVGGIAVYDITDPANSTFVTYINNRDFSVSVEDADDPSAVLSQAGDLGPEGITFIDASVSPTGEPLLAVGNEVSGTTTIFSITDLNAPSTTTLQVLGINDFHGRIEQNLGNREGGAAVLAGAVKQLRTENPNTVFVSAGDNIGASTFTSFSQADKPTIDALVASTLDASAVGNHEFDAGFADLTDRVIPAFGGSQFALGANVYLKGTKTPALDEYWVTEIDGVTVGFIGTVTAQTASMVNPDLIADIEFGDQLEAANRVAAALSDGDAGNGEADVIVLLTHEGSETPNCAALATDTTDYAKLVRGASPAIDAIFSGHTHQLYDCALPVEGWPAGLERPIAQTGQYGMNLGRLTIEIDSATSTVVSLGSDSLPLVVDGAAAYPADPAVAAIVDAAVAEADVVGSVAVGSITADILRGGTGGSDRGVESSLGNLVADQQLWATSNATFAGTPSQIAFMNPGGLRADLLYGENGVVTYKEAAAVQSFGNSLFTMDLTGAQIKAVLEEQWQPDGSSRPKLHLGVSEGFGYRYDPAAARGEHILEMTYFGEVIQPTDVFRVTANSFLAAGGDSFVTFREGTNRADTGQQDLAAAVAYFEEFELVEPAPLGRAVVAGAGEEQPGTENPAPGIPVDSTPVSGGLAVTGATASIGAIVLGVMLALGGAALVIVRRVRSRES